MAWRQLAFLNEVASLSDVAPVNVDHAAAAAGNAATASRQNHKHDVDEGVVGTILAVDGTAAGLGTNAAIPHLDHRHPLGPLVASLDFNQNQAVSFRFEAVATPPDVGVEVEGQAYFDTSVADKHVYVWNA